MQFETDTERINVEAFVRLHRLSIAYAFSRGIVRGDVVVKLVKFIRFRSTMSQFELRFNIRELLVLPLWKMTLRGMMIQGGSPDPRN